MWPPEQVHFIPLLIVNYLEKLNVHFYKSFVKVKAIGLGGASIFTDPEGSLNSDYRLDPKNKEF